MYGYAPTRRTPARRNAYGTRNAYGYGARNAGAAYPGVSDAWSGFERFLWWQSSFGGMNHLCASQGATIVRALQTVIRAEVPLAFTVRGVLYSSADISVDANFGPATFAGLRKVLESVDVPQTILDTIEQDWQRLCPGGRTRAGARGLSISLATMAAVIFVATSRLLPWSSLQIPSTMRTLHFAETAIDDGPWAGQIVCSPFSEGAGGLTGPHRETVPVGASIPRDTPGTPIVPGGTVVEPNRGGGGSGIAVALLLVLGAAMAAGKKKL